MGRPTIARSIKRNRLRMLEEATDIAGQVAPCHLHSITANLEEQERVTVAATESRNAELIAELERGGYIVSKKTARKKAAKKRKR